jgi:predicted thioesterase
VRLPRIGRQASVLIDVTEDDTAAAVGRPDVEVVATTALILFIEAAAAESIDGCCEDGEISVGSAIRVQHLAAAPVGARITATAKVTAVQGRRIDFAVEAHHGRKLLMVGTHQRVVVNRERFLRQQGLGELSH